MVAWRESFGLKLVNILSYLLFTTSTLYTALGPKGSHVGGYTETYLTPAQWLFGVWPLIHTLFFGLLIYQFTERGSKLVVHSLGWRFPLLLFLNAVSDSLYVAHDRLFNILSFCVLCFVAGPVSHLYGTLRTDTEPESLADTVLVYLPFSLYHGFVVVVFFVAAFAAFGVDSHEHPAGVVTKVLVFLTLFFLESTAAGYVFYGNGDVAGATVISLGLLAIFQNQTRSAFIHWSALVFFLISLIAVLRAAVATIQARRRPRVAATDEEQAPLVA